MLDLKNILNNPKEVSSSLLSRGYRLDLKFIEDKAQERKKLIQKKNNLLVIKMLFLILSEQHQVILKNKN
jgi:hypothetical protein